MTMSELNGFDWIDFYKEFAQKLLTYRNNRSELVTKVKKIYEDIGIQLPTLEKDNVLTDIDPFTVFGLFNKSSMKESNRLKIITAVASVFDVKATIPTSFNSIPALNNQNATFYGFIGYRGEDDIEDLWELFDSALKYVSSPSSENRSVVSKYFDLAINKKGNGNSKITMGLYWIAPESFMNLDSRNEWYIYRSGKIPADVVSDLPPVTAKISSETYFTIVEKLRVYLQSDKSVLKNFKELSFEAWRYSEEDNEREKKEKAAQTQRDSKGTGLADADVDTVHYWLYSPGENAFKWDEYYKAGIMAIGWGEIGDLSIFASKDEMKQKMKACIDPAKPYKNAAHATWQFANEMKPGDIVFVKKGMHQLIGRGVVTSEYQYDDSIEDEYKNIRQVNWTDNGYWEHPGQAVMKTLTDVTQYTDYVEKLKALFTSDEDDTNDEDLEEKYYPAYSKEKFLEEVYIDSRRYDTLVGLLESKMNIILQGAPGVGKTFTAKRLAYSIIGEKNPERVMMVQFHQSYTYEDFIEGFRPSEKGMSFDIKKGSFYKFCRTAQDDMDNKYFFIIDEINRGNISKIFGELFMLIENDKRGNELQLLYSNEKFTVPANVYIIGMMNTADRSLAILDYALRRRFAFFELPPGFKTEGFRKYQATFGSKKFDKLIDCIEKLNDVIASDDSLGEGFCIGHSYFCDLKAVDDMTISNIIEYEVIPLLKEYWFDQPGSVSEWSENLRRAIE